MTALAAQTRAPWRVRAMACVLATGGLIAAAIPAVAFGTDDMGFGPALGLRGTLAPEPVAAILRTPAPPANPAVTRAAAFKVFSIAAVLAARDGAQPRPAAAPSPGLFDDQAPLGLRGSDPILPAPAATAEFGQIAIPFGAPSTMRRWNEVRARMGLEQARLDDCLADGDACATPRERRWSEAARAAGSLDGRARIEHVNRAINRLVTYRADIATYGVADRWATLSETLALGGDCEDFAIAKFETLKRAGLPASRMRIVLVRHLLRGEDHAVLSVSLDGRRYILDNLTDEVRSDAEIGHYAPVVAVEETGGIIYAAPVAARDANTASLH